MRGAGLSFAIAGILISGFGGAIHAQPCPSTAPEPCPAGSAHCVEGRAIASCATLGGAEVPPLRTADTGTRSATAPGSFDQSAPGTAIDAAPLAEILASASRTRGTASSEGGAQSNVTSEAGDVVAAVFPGQAPEGAAVLEVSSSSSRAFLVCDASSPTGVRFEGSATLDVVTIAGEPVNVPAEPNTTIASADAPVVVLNEQGCSSANARTDCFVNALHANFVESGEALELIFSSSRGAIQNCPGGPTVCPPDSTPAECPCQPNDARPACADCSTAPVSPECPCVPNDPRVECAQCTPSSPVSDQCPCAPGDVRPECPVVCPPGQPNCDDPCLVNSRKTAALVNDANSNGQIDPGDRVRFTVHAENSCNDAPRPLPDMSVIDRLPSEITLDPNSVRVDGAPAAGASVGACGVTFRQCASEPSTECLRVPIGDLAPGAANAVDVTFEATIDPEAANPDCPGGVAEGSTCNTARIGNSNRGAERQTIVDLGPPGNVTTDCGPGIGGDSLITSGSGGGCAVADRSGTGDWWPSLAAVLAILVSRTVRRRWRSRSTLDVFGDAAKRGIDRGVRFGMSD